MTTLTYTRTNIRFFLLTLSLSVVTALGMQKFSPTLIFILYMLPSLIALFYYYPITLVALWLALLLISILSPMMMNQVGGFFLIPMDPAYFFTIILLTIYAIFHGREFIRLIKANPFLTLLLAIILIYVVIYTPTYGRSALGEARKAYFIFMFPFLMFLSTKTFKDIHKLLLLTFILSIIIVLTSLTRFAAVSSLKGDVNSQMSLILLFTCFSVWIFHINGTVILNRIIDLSILSLSTLITVLTQHRSVLIASSFGLVLIYVLSKNKITSFLKLGFALLSFLAAVGLILSQSPEFERSTVKRLSGIINPSADNTASWRMKGWSRQLNVLSMSTNNLLFGQGLGSYYRAFNSSRKDAFDGMVEPHNAYMTIISNFGLLGLIVYGLLALYFFWKIFSVRKALPRGLERAYAEISILNFGAGHAFMLGYGFCLPIVIFLGMGMSTIKLLESSSQVGRQHEHWDEL